jgi:hypothetical protein
VAFGRVGGTGTLSFATFHHPLQDCTFAETVDLFEAPPEFQESLQVPFQGGILRNGAVVSSILCKRSLFVAAF